MLKERWWKFSKQDQIGHICVELTRATELQKLDDDLYKECFVRALELTSVTIDDPKWKGNTKLLCHTYESLGKLFLGQSTDVMRVYNSLK